MSCDDWGCNEDIGLINSQANFCIVCLRTVQNCNLLNFSWCTGQLSSNMTDANGATAGKTSYVGGPTKQKASKVTAVHNYSPFQSNELPLQKVKCSVFRFRPLSYSCICKWDSYIEKYSVTFWWHELNQFLQRQ